MSISKTIPFEKVLAFYEKHPNIDLGNSYFMGICTTQFPSVQSLSIFESVLASKLKITSKSLQFGSWEIRLLAQFLLKISKPGSTSFDNVSYLAELQKFEDKIKSWFKDFGAMKTLFPSFTRIQWFFIGSFMAGKTDVDLVVLLSTIETDFKFQTRDAKEEIIKIKYLNSLLKSNFAVLKKSESVHFLPQLDVEQLKKDILNSEIQKNRRRPVQKFQTQQYAKPKQGLQEENLYFEALYKVKCAIMKSVKMKELAGPSPRDVKRTEVCRICLEAAEENSLTPLLLCHHSFHLECLREYLNTRIDERNFPIICPMDKCSLKIFGAEIVKLLGDEYKKKYHSYSLERYLETHSKQFYKCPGVDCQSWIPREEGKMTVCCSFCKKTSCMGCGKDLHEGMTCKENEITMRVDENDELFKAFLEGNSCQKCVVCNFIVHKTEGCNHITCRCSFQFCYLCGAQWKTCSCQRR